MYGFGQPYRIFRRFWVRNVNQSNALPICLMASAATVLLSAVLFLTKVLGTSRFCLMLVAIFYKCAIRFSSVWFVLLKILLGSLCWCSLSSFFDHSVSRYLIITLLVLVILLFWSLCRCSLSYSCDHSVGDRYLTLMITLLVLVSLPWLWSLCWCSLACHAYALCVGFVLITLLVLVSLPCLCSLCWFCPDHSAGAR